MRAYTLVSGILFLLVLLAHIARLIAEGFGVLTNPVFDLTTLLAVNMVVWSYRVYRSQEDGTSNE